MGHSDRKKQGGLAKRLEAELRGKTPPKTPQVPTPAFLGRLLATDVLDGMQAAASDLGISFSPNVPAIRFASDAYSVHRLTGIDLIPDVEPPYRVYPFGAFTGRLGRTLAWSAEQPLDIDQLTLPPNVKSRVHLVIPAGTTAAVKALEEMYEISKLSRGVTLASEARLTLGDTSGATNESRRAFAQACADLIMADSPTLTGVCVVQFPRVEAKRAVC